MGRLILVLGGARSGKTRFAMRLAEPTAAPVVFVATAEAGDAEMAARIERHQAERPATWRTLEIPRALGAHLAATDIGRDTVLIDCLSVWLSNELLARHELHAADAAIFDPAEAKAVELRLLDATERLVDWALRRPGETIVVSNEVGSGVVPPYPLGRLYRDLLGRMNQAVAAGAEATYLVVAGIGVDLRRLAAELGEARTNHQSGS